MKLTESYLKKIIKEEMVNEAGFLGKLKARIAPLSGRSIAGETGLQFTEEEMENIEDVRKKREQAIKARQELDKLKQDQKEKNKQNFIRSTQSIITLGINKINNLITNRDYQLAKQEIESLKRTISSVYRGDEFKQERESALRDVEAEAAKFPPMFRPVGADTSSPSEQERRIEREAEERAKKQQEPHGQSRKSGGFGLHRENKQGVNNTMQLTTERLKQIIKEELEAIVNEMGEETETEEVSEVDAEIASLEQQLAEAKGKKAAMKSGKMAGTRKVKNPYAGAASHKMTPAKAPAKRHDKKGGY